MSKIYFSNLDGLRFMAFLNVYFAHSFYSDTPWIMNHAVIQNIREVTIKGVYGVNFFFVLSGFLITYLLEQEIQKTGRINIRNFYIRRVLRIWPLFYLIIFIGFVLVPQAMSWMGEPKEEEASVWYYIFFINNYGTRPNTAILGILWSIAIEEQFYLVWPLLIAYVPHRKKHILFFSIILISFIRRYSGTGGYADTLSCMSDLAVGAWLAYLMIHYPEIKNKWSNISRMTIILLYSAGFGYFFIENYLTQTSSALNALNRLIISLFFAFILFEQNYAKNSFFKMSNFKVISFWGKYTYGLYMLHFTSIYVLGKILRQLVPTNLFHVLVTETILFFIGALVLSWLSYHYYEKPFLKLKDRFKIV